MRDKILVHIVNYEEIKKQHSISKSNYYFKLPLHWFEDHIVLSCEAKILYQYLLLTALRQRKGSVSVYKDHISTLLTIHKGAVKGPLNELKDNDFIRLRGHIYSIEKNKRECEKKETATNPLNGGGGLSAKEISEEIKKLRLGSNLSK